MLSNLLTSFTSQVIPPTTVNGKSCLSLHSCKKDYRSLACGTASQTLLTTGMSFSNGRQDGVIGGNQVIHLGLDGIPLGCSDPEGAAALCVRNIAALNSCNHEAR